MIKTYQMVCSFKLMVTAHEKGLLAPDWEAVDEFVGERKEMLLSGEIELHPTHLFEFSLVADSSWFEATREELKAEEISCRHHYPLKDIRRGRLLERTCSNCKKILATLDNIDIEKQRRIKFWR